MTDHFFRIYSTITLRNEKLIYWRMKTSFRTASPTDFYVDKARAGGSWRNIAGPLTDACAYTDTAKWNWGLDKNTTYRVRFMSGANWAYSAPVRALGEWNVDDYKLVHAICRGESLLTRMVGLPGVLMKRREWGTACSCLDHDTRQPTLHDCPHCYGVGIVGGYYAPIPTMLLPPAPRSTQRGMGEIGHSQRDAMQARCVAYPYIEAEDVWISSTNNDRWRIVQATPIAEHRGIPVIYSLQMGLLPKTDVMHSAAIDAKASTPPTEPANWPTGPTAPSSEYTWESGLDCDRY